MTQRILYKKIITHALVFFGLLSLSLFIVPNIIHAQSSSDTGGGSATGITYDCGFGKDPADQGNCTFYDLINAIKKLVGIATVFALSFSVVVIAYAGFLYLTSGGKTAQRTQANEMFEKVAIGIVCILGAWLIVHLITDALLTPAVKSTLPI